MSFQKQRALPGYEHQEFAIVSLQELHEVRCTTDVLADVFGVSIQTVYDWISDDVIPKPERGLHSFTSVVRSVYLRQRDMVKKKMPEGELYDLDVRDKRAAVEKKELEIRKLKGDLLDRELVHKRTFELARTLRDAIENVPNRISAMIAAENDKHTVHKLLLNELRSTLQGLIEDNQ